MRRVGFGSSRCVALMGAVCCSRTNSLSDEVIGMKLLSSKICACVAIGTLALAGCAADRTASGVVPGDAALVAGGFDIHYALTEPGTIYVVDQKSGRLLIT